MAVHASLPGGHEPPASPDPRDPLRHIIEGGQAAAECYEVGASTRLEDSDLVAVKHHRRRKGGSAPDVEGWHAESRHVAKLFESSFVHHHETVSAHGNPHTRLHRPSERLCPRTLAPRRAMRAPVPRLSGSPAASRRATCPYQPGHQRPPGRGGSRVRCFVLLL